MADRRILTAAKPPVELDWVISRYPNYWVKILPWTPDLHSIVGWDSKLERPDSMEATSESLNIIAENIQACQKEMPINLDM